MKTYDDEQHLITQSLRAHADQVSGPDAGTAGRAIAGARIARRRAVTARLAATVAGVVVVTGVAVGTRQLGAFPEKGSPGVTMRPTPTTTWTWPDYSTTPPPTTRVPSLSTPTSTWQPVSVGSMTTGAPAQPRVWLSMPRPVQRDVVFNMTTRVPVPDGIVNTQLVGASADTAVLFVPEVNAAGGPVANGDGRATATKDRIIALSPNRPMRVLAQGSLGGVAVSPDGRYVVHRENLVTPASTQSPFATLGDIVVRTVETGDVVARLADRAYADSGGKPSSVEWLGDRIYWVDPIGRRTVAWNPLTGDLASVNARPIAPPFVVTPRGMLMGDMDGQDCARYWDPATGNGTVSHACGRLGNATLTPDGHSLLVYASGEWTGIETHPDHPPGGPRGMEILDLATGARRPLPTPDLSLSSWPTALSWEDSTHVLLGANGAPNPAPTALPGVGYAHPMIRVMVRCDIAAATCELAPTPKDMDIW